MKKFAKQSPLISTTSALLVKFGNLEYLSNNSSNELLTIGIALVKKFAKPTIFGTGDSDEPLKSSSFNYLCSPLLTLKLVVLMVFQWNSSKL